MPYGAHEEEGVKEEGTIFLSIPWAYPTADTFFYHMIFFLH